MFKMCTSAKLPFFLVIRAINLSPGRALSQSTTKPVSTVLQTPFPLKARLSQSISSLCPFLGKTKTFFWGFMSPLTVSWLVSSEEEGNWRGATPPSATSAADVDADAADMRGLRFTAAWQGAGVKEEKGFAKKRKRGRVRVGHCTNTIASQPASSLSVLSLCISVCFVEHRVCAEYISFVFSSISSSSSSSSVFYIWKCSLFCLDLQKWPFFPTPIFTLLLLESFFEWHLGHNSLLLLESFSKWHLGT